MRMVDMFACGSVACGRGSVACECGWVERKEKKKKTYFSADGYLADMLRVDVLACGHGRVASGCGHVGVWTWMCCVRMQMSRKERKKKKKKLTLLQTCWHVCCMQMRMSRKERKKKKLTSMWTCCVRACWRVDVLRAGALACGRGCVVCGCRWIERKKRKKRKKLTLLRTCCVRTRWRVCCVQMRMSRKEKEKRKNLL